MGSNDWILEGLDLEMEDWFGGRGVPQRRESHLYNKRRQFWTEESVIGMEIDAVPFVTLPLKVSFFLGQEAT